MLMVFLPDDDQRPYLLGKTVERNVLSLYFRGTISRCVSTCPGKKIAFGFSAPFTDRSGGCLHQGGSLAAYFGRKCCFRFPSLMQKSKFFCGGALTVLLRRSGARREIRSPQRATALTLFILFPTISERHCRKLIITRSK